MKTRMAPLKRPEVVVGSLPQGRPWTPVSSVPALPVTPAVVVQPFAPGSPIRLPPTFPPGSSRGERRVPAGIRKQTEALFGTDLSDVRVHVGPEAGAIGALAFAQGRDLYFAPGHYAPESREGRRILGHELTHVVQQRAGRVRSPSGSAPAVVEDPKMEAEADARGLEIADAIAPLQARPAVPASLPSMPAAGPVIQPVGKAKKNRTHRPTGPPTLSMKEVTAPQATAPWGGYKSKIKWDLSHAAPKRGIIVQHVTFRIDIDDAGTGKAWKFADIDNATGAHLDAWNEYYEAWLVSPGKKAPSTTKNQDHFSFAGLPAVPATQGWIEEEGDATFYETTKSLSDLGFDINQDCPAGAHLESSLNPPPSADVTQGPNSVQRWVRATWTAAGPTAGRTRVTKYP